MDKTQAMVQFLQTCPVIENNPLFFNFGNIRDGAHQIIMRSDDVSTRRPYVDGGVQKRFTFSIDSFKSVSYNSIIDTVTDENLEEFAEIQSVIDWITAQNDLGNYPDFGEDVIIDSMESITERPEMLGVDDTINSPMAIYRISIRIDYLDNTKKLFK